MKNTFILIVLLSSQLFLFSQEITEDNYLKTDKEIWDTYERDMLDIGNIYELHPEKKGSLIIVANRIKEIADKKNIEVAIKYASVPSGLKRLYMVRLNISKDTLLDVFKNLSKETQDSNYGKSIKLHIDSDQIEEGDKICDFQATDSKGDIFKISNLKGQNILLLYGGLSCIREEGRDFLRKYSTEIGPNNLNIVVFNSCSDLNELKELKTKYELGFTFISDFLKDHSPFKIRYGAQSTPTCFLINKDGKVVTKSIGLPEEELEEFKTILK